MVDQTWSVFEGEEGTCCTSCRASGGTGSLVASWLPEKWDQRTSVCSSHEERHGA